MKIRSLAALLACTWAWASGVIAADEALDDLFDLDAPLEGAVEVAPAGGAGPASAPAEGGAPASAPSAASDDGGGAPGLPRLSGFLEFAGAYTTPERSHWSKQRARLELAATGRAGPGLRYKVSARADLDAAYLGGSDYPQAVRNDQRRELALRETYLDFGSGDLEFRVGRQHVVWGEVVGMFVADVVSARDMREFLLPEFEQMRTPQWAVRSEYFAGETHLELLWIPRPSHDDIGKPGADFYPYPLPDGTPVHVVKRDSGLSNSNWGVRASRLIAGWDLSAFYYESLDVTPTLYSMPTGSFELRNDRIRQLGATFSKDLGDFVLKGEVVHTHGRSFNTRDPSAPFGLRASDTLDYVLGIDLPADDWRFNAQLYGRATLDHARGMYSDRNEHGVTLLVNRKFMSDFEAEVLYVGSLNRSDYMLRPKLIWNITQEWRAQAGVDLFHGPEQGLFGRFDNSDRVYVELKHWF